MPTMLRHNHVDAGDVVMFEDQRSHARFTVRQTEYQDDVGYAELVVYDRTPDAAKQGAWIAMDDLRRVNQHRKAPREAGLDPTLFGSMGIIVAVYAGMMGTLVAGITLFG